MLLAAVRIAFLLFDVDVWGAQICSHPRRYGSCGMPCSEEHSGNSANDARLLELD